MDYSPIWISVKTASLTIVIVFFIGLAAAKLVAGLKNEKIKMAGRYFYPASGSPADCGRILPPIFIWNPAPDRGFFC